MIAFLLKIFFTFVLTGAITTFLGYWVHWSFHQPWTAWFFNAHMNHHKIQYPPTDFFSEKYKSAGRDSTVILFTIAFTPVILLVATMMLFGVLSLSIGIATFASLAVWGLAHDYFHDQFHITNTWWKKFSLFLRWRELHYVHHLDMKLNYGIVIFLWDKLFKTYDEARDINLDK